LEKPDAFNSFFLTMTEKVNKQQTEKENAITLLNDFFLVKFPGTDFKTIPVIEAELKSVIHFLKSEHSMMK
jgi:hypothetical protein